MRLQHIRAVTPRQIAIAIGVIAIFCANPERRQALAQMDDHASSDAIQVEFKGQLSARAGGFQVRAQGISWQLDVSASPGLHAIVTQLDGQPVVVKGSVRRETARAPWVLKATTIEAAAANGRGEEYVAVTVTGTLRTGVMAIGAETTGVTITAGAATWDLEVERRHQETVNRLNGATAIVSGHLRRAGGVEVAGRLIVKVRTVRAG